MVPGYMIDLSRENAFTYWHGRKKEVGTGCGAADRGRKKSFSKILALQETRNEVPAAGRISELRPSNLNVKNCRSRNRDGIGRGATDIFLITLDIPHHRVNKHLSVAYRVSVFLLPLHDCPLMSLTRISGSLISEGRERRKSGG